MSPISFPRPGMDFLCCCFCGCGTLFWSPPHSSTLRLAILLSFFKMKLPLVCSVAGFRSFLVLSPTPPADAQLYVGVFPLLLFLGDAYSVEYFCQAFILVDCIGKLSSSSRTSPVLVSSLTRTRTVFRGRGSDSPLRGGTLRALTAYSEIEEYSFFSRWRLFWESESPTDVARGVLVSGDRGCRPDPHSPGHLPSIFFFIWTLWFSDAPLHRRYFLIRYHTLSSSVPLPCLRLFSSGYGPGTVLFPLQMFLGLSFFLLMIVQKACRSNKRDDTSFVEALFSYAHYEVFLLRSPPYFSSPPVFFFEPMFAHFPID